MALNVHDVHFFGTLCTLDRIESFLRLLENIHPKEEIAAYIEEGIQYSGM